MTNEIITYNTLEEIRLKKDQLRDAIYQDEEQISILWNGLFAKQENATKGEFIAALVSKSIMAIDAFIMVRKLMKTYSNVFTFFKKSKNK